MIICLVAIADLSDNIEALRQKLQCFSILDQERIHKAETIFSLTN